MEHNGQHPADGPGRAIIGFSHIQKEHEWKDHAIFIGLLIALAVWVNRDIRISGLYMDDLYLWSCYGEQSFLEYVLPMGSSRFRFLYYLVAWLEMGLVGTHVGWFVPINIFFNVLVAVTVYFMGYRLSRSKAVAFLAAVMYLASRFAYYQIGQVLGLMETLALWLAIAILWNLYRFVQTEGKEGRFFACVGLYFVICFVHERYMVLVILLLLAAALKKCRRLRCVLSALGSAALVQLIRFAVIGTILPAGAGRTKVAETFHIKEAAGFALDEIAYIFGINIGPDYLNGSPWGQTPWPVRILVFLGILMIVLLCAGFVVALIREKNGARRAAVLRDASLFIVFIGLCILCSCVTIRVEMRWIYAPYTAALLFMAYMYGILTEGIRAEFYLKRLWPWGTLILAYVLFMFSAELYYRSCFGLLYFWPPQTRYNSLADETYGKYGEGMEGKTVYILGNTFGVSDFNAKTFFKVFQKDRTADRTKVVFIDSIKEVGLIDKNTIVLKEDPAHDCYEDVTAAVRDIKVCVDYGYYYDIDGWMDEHSEITVMTGESGRITFEIIFPGVIMGGEVITVTKEDDPPEEIGLYSNIVEYEVEGEPWQLIHFKFDYNFYMQNAPEQRGEDRLAALVHITLD